MVKIEDLTAGYDREVVLKDISLIIPNGKLYGIVGPNGAGKSTLVRSFFRICTIFSGSIRVDETNILKLPINRISSLVAVQRPIKSLDIQLSVTSYIRAGALKISDESISNVLIEFQLESLSDRNISSLSDGQLQRVNLAQAVVRNPRVFLLDEPTAHLDLKYRYQLLSGIKNRLKGGASAIAVIHDLDLAKEFCDQVVLMQDGEIVDVNSPDVLNDKQVLHDLFGLESVL